jgi:DNA helicase-2/ATP-dependent DNA helicase PcrA
MSNPLFDSLNPAQQDAVGHIDGPMLILAGPGSGKTRVITHRIAHLIESGVSSYRILAMTFTNKAAEEMKNRLNKLSPDHDCWLGTFHKFCARLLRYRAPLVGLSENFTIYDMSDSRKLIKQAIELADVDVRHYSPDKIAEQISTVKSSGLTADNFEPMHGNALQAIVGKVYPRYQQLLQMANGVDFDDLLLHTVDLLRNNPELRAELDERYQYMLVDEYQDTNTVQYQLIRLLNHDYRNLAVTGDPDQSIYGWRGANIQNILGFEQDYPNVKVVRLEQNYRSTKRILRVADQLISNNEMRKHKTLHTDNEEGTPVTSVAYKNPQEEANDIAETIAVAIRSGKNKASDFAIFYRTNWLSRALENSLRLSGIPYQIVNGHEFFQRREVKDVVSYLHLLNNPRDNVALERIINVPPRKIGKVTLGRLRDYAIQNGLSMLEASRRSGLIDSMSKGAATKVAKFVTLYDRISEAKLDDVSSVLQLVLAETGYREWLTDDGSEEGHERAKNVDELLLATQEFDSQHPDDGGLETFLEQAALTSDTDAWESESEFVTMMTLHAAKGLEFPHVFIVGMEDGILPHERSSNSNQELEEERRLMFVGITRAEQRLQLSRCMSRFRRGSFWPVIASRFLMELPRDEMDIFEPGGGMWSSESDGDFGGDPWDFMDDSGGFEEKSIQIERIEPVQETEPSFDQSDDDGNGSVVKEAAATFPRLMTGAQLAQAQELESKNRLHPDVFEVGMNVRHEAYGVGTIATLSGHGKKKTATVVFEGTGQKSFRLAYVNLDIVER